MNNRQVINARDFQFKSEKNRFETALRTSFTKAVSEMTTDSLERAFLPEKVATLNFLDKTKGLKAA